MNEQELQELEALCKAATPGPWKIGYRWHGGWPAFRIQDMQGPYEFEIAADCDLIAAAITAIPALIAEVRRLRAGWDAALADLDTLDDLIPIDIAEVLDG